MEFFISSMNISEEFLVMNTIVGNFVIIGVTYCHGPEISGSLLCLTLNNKKPLDIMQLEFSKSVIPTIYIQDFLFSASMIAMAPAIMKIISKTSLTRMNLMVQNTQIAGKQLFPIDQNMNINHFRASSKTTFCFIIEGLVTIHTFFDKNYSTTKKSSIQNFRELFIISKVFFNLEWPFLNDIFDVQLGSGHTCSYRVCDRGWYHLN